MWMQRAFTFIQVRINGGRHEGFRIGGTTTTYYYYYYYYDDYYYYYYYYY